MYWNKNTFKAQLAVVCNFEKTNSQLKEAGTLGGITKEKGNLRLPLINFSSCKSVSYHFQS